MPNYWATVVEVRREIKNDRLHLDCQLKYYEYVQENVAKMTGEIDRKIEGLRKERERIVKDFMIAPQRIKEVKLYIMGLGAKRNKMLIEPKIERVMELRAKLEAMGVVV